MFQQNTVLLVGRLGDNAEMKHLPNGRVASMSLAVDHSYKDKAGKWHTETSWFRVVTYWPWLIDNVISTEATKGRRVFVQGSLRARSWEQDGEKRSTVEIEVDASGGLVPVSDDQGPVNQVNVIGRLGDHAEIKTLPGAASKVSNFNVAVDRSFKNAANEWVNATDWLRVVTFQPSLIDKVLAKQGTKGRRMVIQGALRTRSWEQDGQKRTRIEIEVDGSGTIVPVVEDKA